MLTLRVKWASVMAAALVGELAAPLLWAQADEQLQEVVVTARRRIESLQDVPITVTAFTQQDIQSAGITAPRDYIAMVPNMTLVETQNIGNSFVTIRGISQARNSEPSVAVLVDGVLETNPYEFNQELFDIEQIEVLKGPQGALYGRDAIAGAILIRTATPTDQFQGTMLGGVGNGLSERAQLALSGPIDSAGTLKYRASVSFYNTDGYLKNWYLDRNADPLRDYSGRLRLLWTPSGNLTADLRVYADWVDTTAYYFVIPRSNEADPFTSFTTPPDANNITSPIQVNNEGDDDRDIFDVALKLDYSEPYGTFTSITDFDETREIDDGDAYDFRPVTTSVVYALTAGIPASMGGPYDESQSQYINVRAWSQELRFTSTVSGGLSWIGGAYFVHTDRFVSTGNMVDRGTGTYPVYLTPRLSPPNYIADYSNVTFLADAQDNYAWAVFGDVTYAFSRLWELDVALRYDQDQRKNTTDTPEQFLPDPAAYTGEVRSHTFSAWQPKFTLRYKPDDHVTVYGGWSQGFRSGGFNQTGVGAVARASGILGVNDLFNAEIVDTWEIGAKAEFFDRRLSADLSLFHSHSQNGYFFVYLPANSTQNLGNLNATYHGGELALTGKVSEQLQLYANAGLTYSRITQMADPTVIGNEAPLVSRYTLNVGGLYTQPLSGELRGTVRVDFNEIGRTWWDPYNVTSRNPVPLLDLRLGLETDRWSATAWSKNLTNTIYNAEFSPGGFLWRALPRRYGVDFQYHF